MNIDFDTSVASNFCQRFLCMPLKGKIPVIKGWNSDKEYNKKKMIDILNYVDNSVSISFKDWSNWGIITGQRNWLIVLDIDMKDYGVEYWNELIAINGEPDTFKVQTGSDGFHYYFKYNSRWMNGLKSKAKIHIDEKVIGIDLKTDGGQIVLPGSIHPETGKKYIHKSGNEINDVPEWLELFLIKHFHENSNHQICKSNKNTDKVDIDQIADLVRILPDKYADEYEKWRNVGFALLSTGSDLAHDIFDEFSQRSSKYSEKEVEKFIKNNTSGCESHTNPITYRSIYHWAELENPTEYRRIVPYSKKVLNGIFGDMFLHDFKSKYTFGKVIEREMIPEVINDLKKCIFYLDSHDKNQWFICDKGIGIGGVETGIIEYHKGPICKLESIKIMKTDEEIENMNSEKRGKGRPRKDESLEYNNVNLWDFIWQHRESYRGWGMEYNIASTTSGCINLFRGFQAKRISYEQNDNDIQIINDHIRDIMCNGKKDIYDWLIKILAWIIKKSEKTGVMPLLIGPEGVGKTMVLEWFANHILGLENSFCCGTLEEITGRFGGMLENKRGVFVNEVKGASRHDQEKLRNLITDYFINMEKKGENSRQIKSNICIIGISNHYDQHLIKKGQRRIVAIECASKPRETQYYEKLASVLSNNADKYYSYLMDVDLTNFVPNVFPENKFQEELIEDNKDSHIMFIERFNWSYNNTENGYEWMWMKSENVYVNYLDWCKRLDIKYKIDIKWFVRKSNNMIESCQKNNITYWRRSGTKPDRDIMFIKHYD